MNVINTHTSKPVNCCQCLIMNPFINFVFYLDYVTMQLKVCHLVSNAFLLIFAQHLEVAGLRVHYLKES